MHQTFPSISSFSYCENELDVKSTQFLTFQEAKIAKNPV